MSGPGDLGNFMRVLPLPPITTRVPRRAFAPPGGTGDGDEAPDFCVIFKSVYSCPNPQQSSGGRVGQGVMINYIDMTCLPSLQDELVVDRSASIQVRPSLEALKREAADLESQIRQLQVGTHASPSSYFFFFCYTVVGGSSFACLLINV